MRLIVKDTLAYPGQLIGHYAAAWRTFVTDPIDTAMLGPIRLILGVLCLWSWVNLGLDLSAWLGPDGWLPADQAIAFRRTNLPWGWSLWDFVPQAGVVPAYGLGLVVIGLWAAGAFCRVTGPLTWLIVHSTVRRLPIMLFGFDAVLGTFILYLAVTGTGGESLSVDRWLARRRGCEPSPSAPVRGTAALRILQLHLCLIYAGAGFSKLLGEPWWNGTAAYFLVANTEFRGISILESLGESHGLTALSTFVPLWTEILYPALIWPKRLRPLVLILAIGMHLTIAATLGLWEFSLTMIAANLAFIDGAWAKRAFARNESESSAGA
jgi:hypothetical protein